MSAVLFWLTEYDWAAREAFFGAIDALTVVIEPSLAAFPRMPVEAVRPSRITVDENKVLVTEPQHHDSRGKFDIRAIVAGDLSGILDDIHAAATEVAARRLESCTATCRT